MLTDWVEDEAREAQARRQAWALLNGGGFLPSQISAITSWLRVASSTVTGSGISSLPDLLNSNPAVQGTDAQRPALGTAANGLRLITGASGKVLTVPLIGGNSQTIQWGMAMHISTPLGAAARTIFGVRTGNGADKLRVNFKVDSDESLRCVVYLDDSNNRSGLTAASQIGDSTVHFVTAEFDGDQVTEATRLTLTIDGVVKSLTFANEAGSGTMPPSMVDAVGNGLIGAFNTAGGSAPFTGFIGPNIYFLGSKMAGATEGLLTAAARTALSNFERPT